MTRKTKLLGLALAPALALSVVAASAASADPTNFTAEVGGTETAGVMGAQTSAFGDTFTVGPSPLSCEVATVSGEAKTAGTSSTRVGLKPTYNNCHVIVGGFLTLPATVTSHECEYVLNATKNTTDTAGNPTTFSSELEITCPVGQQIVIHVYASSAKHLADEALCIYDIGKQTINHHIELANHANSPDDIVAHVTELPIVLDNTRQSATCSEETHPEATYDGEDTLTAEDEESNPVNFSVG